MRISEVFLHGGDYNPEQWLKRKEILARDIEYFKKAGINTVSMGMFSWSMLEPAEGQYDFSWLEERVEALYANGISTILSTPSGARPKWLADAYPEVLRVRSDRGRNLFGGRHNHCYHSPVYREKVGQINEALAKAFGQRKSVRLWHISNEYGGECHCPLCQEKFRDWLRQKYGDIERLNDAWNTIFWSHRYTDFAQVESPSEYGEDMLHGLSLDWKRFVTDSTLDFMKAEVAAIRKYSDKPVTTNLMYDYKGLDYKRFRDVCDIVSWDNYPAWHKGRVCDTALDSGFFHDWIRSIKQEPFLLMESSPSATNWQPVSKLKRPGILRAQSFQAIAHGSDSVLYFQLRKSLGASEKFHGAVIDHYGGEDTRVFREVCEVGRLLEEIGEACGSRVEGEAAILYDRENEWAMQQAQGPRNIGLHYKEQLLKHYRGLKSLGLNVDVISTEHDLEGYRLLVLPMAYMFPQGFAEKLESYVRKGGTLVLGYWSGIVDENDLCYLYGTPHGLEEVLGLRSMEIDALYEGEENRVYGEGFLKKEGYRCSHLCDLVKPLGAEVLLRYAADFYRDYPALCRNSYKEGRAFYLCTDMEEDFYPDFYSWLNEAYGLYDGKPLPLGIEINRRRTKTCEYLFVQSFREEDFDFEAGEGYRLVYGEAEKPLAYLNCRLYRKSLP